jgi:hypothetical protein
MLMPDIKMQNGSASSSVRGKSLADNCEVKGYRMPFVAVGSESGAAEQARPRRGKLAETPAGYNRGLKLSVALQKMLVIDSAKLDQRNLAIAAYTNNPLVHNRIISGRQYIDRYILHSI